MNATLSVMALGVLLLLIIPGLVFSRIRRKLEALISLRFVDEEILVATTRANFLGEKSKGGAQIRGNGALVLTRNELYFIRAVPQKEFRIPIRFIRNVSMPRFFNGKSIFVPLLCVTFKTESGEDSIAWALRNPKQWKNAIDRAIQS